MNPKEVFHNTAYSVQLPYIAGHSFKEETERSSSKQEERRAGGGKKQENCSIQTE